MLARAQRIPREFLAKPKGRRVSFRFGTVVFLPLVPARAAVVVSKKTFRAAVSRNRVRRRVAAILRRVLREKKLAKSILIYANTAALRAPFSELEQEIKNVVLKA